MATIPITGVDYSIENPLNREPLVKDLISEFLTNPRTAYDRNHGPIPHLDHDTYRVNFVGSVTTPLSLSISDLSMSFPQHDVTCALQCAGNRRHTMRTLQKEVDGIDWGDGAVMNCRWRGPRLRDVLLKLGIMAEKRSGHVAFGCHWTEVQEDKFYEASIELERALSIDAEIILALEMNSEPLSANHGAPVRVIAPGIAGARSVKWLDSITVQSFESENHYQKRDYKILPPDAIDKATAAKYWDATPALQDMPINSVIGSPQSGDTVRVKSDGMIAIQGYALPQGSKGPVVRVEISVDGGRSWKDAELSGERSKWSWALWEIQIPMKRGKGYHILSRATDKAGNRQRGDTPWNLRGVGYNGYGESRDVEVV